MSRKEQLLSAVAMAKNQESTSRNRMGCSESWYNPLYCIAQTFEAKELENMPEKELDDLIRLAEEITSALY